MSCKILLIIRSNSWPSTGGVTPVKQVPLNQAWSGLCLTIGLLHWAS